MKPATHAIAGLLSGLLKWLLDAAVICAAIYVIVHYLLKFW